MTRDREILETILNETPSLHQGELPPMVVTRLNSKELRQYDNVIQPSAYPKMWVLQKRGTLDFIFGYYYRSYLVKVEFAVYGKLEFSKGIYGTPKFIGSSLLQEIVIKRVDDIDKIKGAANYIYNILVRDKKYIIVSDETHYKDAITFWKKIIDKDNGIHVYAWNKNKEEWVKDKDGKAKLFQNGNYLHDELWGTEDNPRARSKILLVACPVESVRHLKLDSH